MTALEIKTRDIIPELNPAEKVIAVYITENIENVMSMPIGDLAELSKISKASWVRFSKRMGYTGFREFRRALLTDFGEKVVESRNENGNNLYGIKLTGVTAERCADIVNKSLTSISDTFALLDVDSLEAISEKIIQANTVAVCGMGASGLVGDDFCHKLLRIGIKTISYKDFHVSLTMACSLNKGDVVVFFSHSGRTDEILELMEIGKSRGATTVAITKFGDSPLGVGCDYCLYTSTQEPEKRSGAMSSRMAQLLVVDFLFATIISKGNYTEMKRYLEQSYETNKRHRKNNF